MGDTTSSRHWGVAASLVGLDEGASLCDPVGVCMVSSWVFGEGARDWKA